MNNQDITVYGDGNQSRDYTYVSDSVNAYCLLSIRKNLEGEKINFGSGSEIKMKDLAEIILNLTNSNSKIIFDGKLRSAETPRLLCNREKAKKLVGWEPKIPFEVGIKNTIEFFKDKKELHENLKFMT